MAQEELTRLSQEVQALADGSGAARNEHQRLQEELHSRAMEDTDGARDGAGVGEGAKQTSSYLFLRSAGKFATAVPGKCVVGCRLLTLRSFKSKTPMWKPGIQVRVGSYFGGLVVYWVL